jgi:hypothetical protein
MSESDLRRGVRLCQRPRWPQVTVAALALAVVLACARQRDPFSLGPWLYLVDSLPTDSAVMARVARENPCPTPVPRGWIAGDTTLAGGVRCSLVAAGAAAIRNLNTTPQFVPLLRATDPAAAICVSLSAQAYRDPTTGVVDTATAQWGLEFFFRETPGIVAAINRITGAARAGRTPHDPEPDNESQKMKVCRFKPG